MVFDIRLDPSHEFDEFCSFKIKGHILLSALLKLARMIHKLVLRDREDERSTGQPQGLESEAYLTVRRRVRDPRTPGRTVISAGTVANSCFIRASLDIDVLTPIMERRTLLFLWLPWLWVLHP